MLDPPESGDILCGHCGLRTTYDSECLNSVVILVGAIYNTLCSSSTRGVAVAPARKFSPALDASSAAFRLAIACRETNEHSCFYVHMVSPAGLY